METTIDSVIIEIGSNADKTDENMTDLVNVLKDLKNLMHPMITSLNSLNNGFKNVNNGLKNTNRTVDNSRQVFGKFKGSVGSLTKAFLGLVGISSLSKFFTEGITQSYEYVENMNLLNVSLRENSKRALEFANSMQRVLGVDSSKVIRYQTIFFNLAEGFGISSDEAYTMSKNLTQLSYDMSSFLNIPIDQAMQKIKSGFSGEIEPMRAVGIALDQATLQETAYRLGINKSVSTMTRAQKTQLLYYQIMTKTEKMQGDMARTLVQPANAIRVLKEQFTLLARAVGNIVIPVLMKIIPYVMVLTKWLTTAAQTIANFLGFELDVNGWESASINISDGIDDIGDSAAGTTKELKKMLAPFDELNVIDFGNNGSGSGGTLSDGGLLDIPLPEYDALAGALSQNLEDVEKRLKDILPIILSAGGALAGWKLADMLGLKGKQKFGLALTIGSIPFYVEGVAGIADGELTPEKFMKAFAGAAGLGVGAGMLTGSWKIGLVVTAILTSATVGIGIGNWLKQQFPDSIDWYIKEVNLNWDKDSVIEKIFKTTYVILGTIGDAITTGVRNAFGQEWGNEILWFIVDSIGPLAIIDNITDIIVNGTESHLIKPVMRNLKDGIWLALKNLIMQIAKSVEKIPVIGKGIAKAIRTGFEKSENEISKTIEDTTTSSIEASRNRINNKASDAGNGTGISYMKSMRQRIIDDMDSLNNTMERTISTASTNSTDIAISSGTNIGENWMGEMRNRISNDTNNLNTTMERTISTASTNSTDIAISSGTNIGNNWMIEMKNRISNDTNNLNTTMERTISTASANSSNTAINSGTNIGSRIMNGMENNISNSQRSLETRITNTIRNANASVDTSSSARVGEDIGTNLKSGIDRANIGQKLRQIGIQAGSNLGNGISNNMIVEGSTLGRTLNSALSTAINKIKNNNWNIFGSGGLLSNLLNFRWSFFETGGFPTEGEAFIARENGPELVGRIGNKSAVANNDQIIAGIAQGVSAGVSQAIGGNQQKQPINVYVGNRKVYSGYGEYANTENNMYGVNVIKV